MPPKKPARRSNSPRPSQENDRERGAKPGREARPPRQPLHVSRARRPAKQPNTKPRLSHHVPSGPAGVPMYLVQTQPGIGRLAWNEIQETLSRAELDSERHITGKDDVLLFHTASGAEEILELRTIEDLFVIAVRAFNISSEIHGLRQMHAVATRSESVATALHVLRGLQPRLPKDLTFRVVARATGKQDYPRKAIAKAVADAVRDAWPGRWLLTEDEESAHLEIWATLFGNELIIALRLSDASLRHRHRRVVNRPAALRPAVAAAMIRYTQPSIDDVFLDPMAGTGTIVAERALAGPYDRLIAGDISRTAVAALAKNLQPIGGDLAIRRLDATDLPFADGEISKIAVNLPFGRQVNHPDELRMLYLESFKEWARVVKPGGLIVILASEVELVRDVLADIPKLRVRAQHNLTILGHPATIMQIERR